MRILPFGFDCLVHRFELKNLQRMIVFSWSLKIVVSCFIQVIYRQSGLFFSKILYPLYGIHFLRQTFSLNITHVAIFFIFFENRKIRKTDVRCEPKPLFFGKGGQ